jgi:SRSO17 transposase
MGGWNGYAKIERWGSTVLAYVEGLTSVIGHADRAKPLRDYCVGLMLPCERKSVEPMAAITAPERTAAQDQSLLHFVGEGRWSDEKVLAKVRELVLPEMERHGPIEAWIIDDTSFPKKGQHSVGVARQYCGELGKHANHVASLPVAYRLYLPKERASDRKRRRKVGIPYEISFKTKPEIALAQPRARAGLYIRWRSSGGTVLAQLPDRELRWTSQQLQSRGTRCAPIFGCWGERWAIRYGRKKARKSSM